MSKRDEDGSGPDMELGMTTAERRRRRRRGGGLRVPSDNVPRRTTTAPPVAPVPEDPALAMSIAYSFSNDGSQPVALVDQDFSEPIAPDSATTHIDPPTDIAPAGDDFDAVKTREMSAVDLQALGLDETMIGGQTLRTPKVEVRDSGPNIEVDQSLFETKSELTVRPPVLPKVEISMEAPITPSMVVPAIEEEEGEKAVEVDMSEPDAASSTLDVPVQTEEQASSQLSAVPDAEPEPPGDEDKEKRPRRERVKTMALSEDDLEEVRDAIRAAEQARISQPVPVVTEPESSAEPLSVPDIYIHELAERADAETADVVEAKVEPPPAPPARTKTPSGMHETPGENPPRSRPPSIPPTPPGQSQSQSHATPPPPPPAATAKPPAPPPAPKKDKPAPVAAKPEKELKGEKRGKPWFVDLFDEDYLRTLPFLTPQATQAEAEFVIDAMGLSPGAQVLDVGCGYGRHAMELAARGFHVVGLDLSTPLLVRGGEEAHRRGLTINFIRGDMRELDFDAQFDGAYCLFSTFGYFDDETNKKTASNIARALKPGGRVMFEILNRDYVIADLPTRVWWEGEGCVVLEEVELNYFSSRIQVNRSVVFDDGRQLEQEISVRAYSLHEVGKLMHSAGFRVLEVSGGYQTRGRFFGNQSRHIIVVAERKDPSSS